MLAHSPPNRPGNAGLSALPKAVNRALCTVLWLVVAVCPSVVKSQLPSGPFPLPEITVSYVSEVPWPADAGAVNPLERWAKKLSADWAPQPSEANSHLNNLRPELSWGHLKKSAINNRAQIFVIQAYELLEQGEAAGIMPLLTPSRNGKAASTEFVILRRREAKDEQEGRRFTMSELQDQEILVDRGGCGDLVYRWLETEIKTDTARAHRETFAEFHSAKSAAQAVLAVYFGEAYACVVSRESSLEVFRTNPRGFQSKLEEVRSSPSLLKYIIACRKDLATEKRKEVINSAAAIRLEHQGTWALAVPSADDMKNLTALVARWQDLLGNKNPVEPGPPAAPPVSTATPPAKQTAASESSAGEGRQP